MRRNKYQEVLEELRNISASERQNLLYDILQELVDKETPMEPVKSFYGDYLCGKCNNLVWESFTPDRHERCNDKECGQVVDWSEEE